MQEAGSAIFKSAQDGGRSDRLSVACGKRKLLDSSQICLKPLIKKVSAKTEAAYYLEAKPESGFVSKPSKQTLRLVGGST